MDPDRLARILEQLDAADATWLREQLFSRQESRANRIVRRDRAVIRAMERYSAQPTTAAAKDLERRLRRRVAHGRRAAPAGDTLDAVLEANGGRPLGWRRIYDIAMSYRLQLSRLGIANGSAI